MTHLPSNADVPAHPKSPENDHLPIVTIRHGEIHVENLQLITSLAIDSWGRPNKEQPALVSVALTRYDKLSSAAMADLYKETLSYSIVAKAAKAAHNRGDAEQSDGRGVLDAHWEIASHMKEWLATELTIETKFPKGLNRSDDGWSVRSKFTHVEEADADNGLDAACREVRFSARNLRIPCIIGIRENHHERTSKQDVMVTIEAVVARTQNTTRPSNRSILEFREAVLKAIDFSDAASFETVEALALHSGAAFRTGEWSSVSISVDKPHAIAVAGRCGVTMSLDYDAVATD